MSRTGTLSLAALLVLSLSGTGVATAHHNPEHAGGPPAGSSVTEDAVTEDNDDDGVPNAPDPVGDADNRHPSGKDKHEEAGGSGNQGNAASEPDANGTGPERDEGGLDQPGGPGGLDVLDQDGNNGCGNDEDFEDDNEGWCGKPPTPEVVTPPEEEIVTPPSVSPPNGGGGGVTPDVLGEIEVPEAGVLGELEEAGVAGAVGAAGLAFTGVEALPLVALALALAVAGLTLVWIARRRAARGY